MENTNTWAPSPEHPGYRYKTIQRGDCTIMILRPELSEAERQKREKHVKTVTERALATYIHKGRKTT